ncbi:MAG: tetratricopeptide repeat protein, partial [Ktedonobacteraceae bacterium]|nr:tetratricopeptide repeat protein [Ktedonobacteraceae bacterium]
LHEQAVLFSKQKCYEEAEPLFQRALEIRQRYLGPQHHNVAETLYQLAYFHQLQQQTAEALSLYQQALAIYEQSLGSHHPKTNATRTAYIRLLRELDRGEEAAAVEAQVQASEPSPL